MGGLVVVVGWDRPVAAHALDPMLALTPHRATGGTRRIAFAHAALAESFFAHDARDDPTVTTLGHFAIVGDLRLWNRDGLRARAGGTAATAGMNDRRLLLSAYQRTGIDFLDDVDGDFAFVIWDDRERRVLAVRDRFGVKPLYLERTATGIRFASEVKQLAATSARSIEPCVRSVAEHVTGRHTATRYSFFHGIERVPPSTALAEESAGQREIRYWDPSPDSVPSPPVGGIADGFRDHLVDSVRRHLAGATSAVAHLTGGLDSTSITAAAHILANHGQLPSPIHTVSAIFPENSMDESTWINETVARQPFHHHDSFPKLESTGAIEADTWEVDAPRWSPVPGVWPGLIDAAHSVGADLVLTGYGGDEVLDQSSVLADLLRQFNVLRWISGVHLYSSLRDQRLHRVMATSIRGALPAFVKRSLRASHHRTKRQPGSLIRQDILDQLQAVAIDENPRDFGFPSLTQNLLISYARAPQLVLLLEQQEALHAYAGLDVTHPFLDRSVVEYVASIPSTAHPLDGRTKTLARHGFSECLPRSVLNRRAKTVANEYLDTLAPEHYRLMRSRYPIVSDPAQPYLDADCYGARLHAFDTATPIYGDGTLWRAWAFMVWLDELNRYQRRRTAGP